MNGVENVCIFYVVQVDPPIAVSSSNHWNSLIIIEDSFFQTALYVQLNQLFQLENIKKQIYFYCMQKYEMQMTRLY